jgi:DNA repair protein RecO (recombination protein O)
MHTKAMFVVLRKYPFGENGMVVHVFSDSLGRVPLLLKNARSRKAVLSYSSIRPLYMFEGVLTRSGNFYHVREARPLMLLDGIMSDPRKTAIAFFLADVWSGCLREQDEQIDMFAFIKSSVELLERMTHGWSYFHHWAMLRTAHHLGFSPGVCPFSDDYYLDLTQGEYTQIPPAHPYSAFPEQAKCVSWLCQHSTLPPSAPPNWSPAKKHDVLRLLIDFFRLHVDGFKTPGSLEVLNQL